MYCSNFSNMLLKRALFYSSWCFVCTSLHTMCMSSAHQSQKRASDPLGLKLETAVRYHVGTDNGTQVLCKKICLSSPSVMPSEIQVYHWTWARPPGQPPPGMCVSVCPAWLQTCRQWGVNSSVPAQALYWQKHCSKPWKSGLYVCVSVLHVFMCEPTPGNLVCMSVCVACVHVGVCTVCIHGGNEESPTFSTLFYIYLLRGTLRHWAQCSLTSYTSL